MPRSNQGDPGGEAPVSCLLASAASYAVFLFALKVYLDDAGRVSNREHRHRSVDEHVSSKVDDERGLGPVAHDLRAPRH